MKNWYLGYSGTNQRYQEHGEPNRICKPAKAISKFRETKKNGTIERLKHANKTNGITKLGPKLLNNETEASRNFVEHRITESPMWFRRDLLLGVPRRDFEFQQRI